MKKIMVSAALLIGLLNIVAFKKTQEHIDDALKMMGISKEEANMLMKENLLYSSLATPNISNYKNIANNNIAALVKDLGNYMKTYFKSKEVETAYQDYRKSIMPGKQEGIDVKARIEEIKNDLKKTQEDKKVASAELKKLYEATIEMLEKQLTILQNPNHPEYAMYAGIVTLTPEEKEVINLEIKEFNKSYPENIQQYIKIKLNEFLILTSDIDFNAKLIEKNGKLRFENPVFESKDNQWKKCFRAGKETITTARAFAQQWIKELN
ncbi:MAG: hypothetical protein ACOVNY_07815 [Chitinophagaceae bacterium]